MGLPLDYDPLSVFTLPPKGETPHERLLRETREAEQKRVSDRIDEQLKMERAMMKKQKGVVRVLLLGQSESGKSTTLKNFRLKYARAAWKKERASWRAVIQLNLLRSINTILDTVQAEMDNLPLEPPTTSDSTSSPSNAAYFSPTPSSFHHHRDIDLHYHDGNHDPHDPHQHHPHQDYHNHHNHHTSFAFASPVSAKLTGHHQLLKLRLAPLRRVEKDLRCRLGAGAEEDYGGGLGVMGEVRGGHGGWIGGEGEVEKKRSRTEFGVRRVKDALEASGGGGAGNRYFQQQHVEGNNDEATEVISSCREDMKALWTDGAVRAVLTKRGVRVEDSAGFFLDDLDRIATRTYEPSDDDVLRARLRTLGVQEHRIKFDRDSGGSSNSGGGFLGGINDFGNEWVLYDVGGSRTARQAWLPYFDNVNAIIFLAPISCFNERLLEDPLTNRLEDSFLLWRSVVSSKLLAKTTLILFMNKCDLLKRKLKSGGVKVRDYLPSYGDRPNEVASVVKYLREKFKDICKTQSPEPRVSYYYATSVTDTKATATTLKTVRDSILREHLKSADFV